MALEPPVLPDDLRVYPEFSNPDIASDAFLQQMIDDADLEIDQAKWGSNAAKAEKYLAMHYATLFLRKNGGAAGSLTGTRVGEVGVQYAQPVTSLVGTGLVASLSTTSYGLMYARLIRLQGYGIATTDGC